MRKKTVLLMIMIIMFIYGCQKNVQIEKVDNDTILLDETIEIENDITLEGETIEVVKMPSTEKKDEMVTEILETAFTVEKDDYNYDIIDYSFW